VLGAIILASLVASGGKDWLIDPSAYRSSANITPESVTLGNGLISRTWRRVGAGIGCYSLRCESTGEEFIRAILPEARVTLHGRSFAIGGLDGQPVHNFILPEWLDKLKPLPDSFRLVGIETHPIQARMAYKPRPEWLANPVVWPPKGTDLIMSFEGPEGTVAAGVRIDVHTELYDGLPLFGKWFELHVGGKAVTVDTFVSETLACVEADGDVEDHPNPRYPNLHFETDFTTVASSGAASQRETVKWLKDPSYGTQVNYNLATPCLVEVSPPLGPKRALKPDETFQSFHAWTLVGDSTDETRKTLALCRMYRTLAPWASENPLIFHCARSDSEYVRGAIDQAAKIGFELVIMTFGSGYDVEDESPANIARMKELADYAHSKGIALGGYSLLASRSIDAENDVVNPATGKPGGFATFGASPCLGSKWGEDYFRKLYAFYEKTGCDVLEHDGSYPGDACASTTHHGHKGYEDSRWNQWEIVTNFYKWCRGHGVYLNVPDWYFLSGANKTAMGYRETNWSLPRAQQEIIERQNIYDGTRYKSPTMGWMFVPLMEYQGGGAAATIEPLHEHLDHYERRLQNLLGAGVQACFRGPRLYDTPETEAVVRKWVSWYKAHRAILDSDIVPLRRADGRSWDGILHVNPALPERALAALYNPLKRPIEERIRIPLTYAGLTGSVRLSVNGSAETVKLNGKNEAEIFVKIPPQGFTWVVFKSGP